MRKRKKPIVLLTIFGVLVVAVIGFNAYTTASPSDGHDHANEAPGAHEEEEKPMLAPSRQPTDGKTVASDAAAKMGGPTAAPIRGPKGGPGGPKTSILRPTPQAMKPKPNDSATSQQWWTEESSAKSGGN